MQYAEFNKLSDLGIIVGSVIVKNFTV